MFKLCRSYFSAAFQHSELIAIPRPELLLFKLELFAKDGIEACEVICDYDYTLTQYKAEGKRLLNSFEGLQFSLSPEQKARCNALAGKYYPIEADSEYPYEEKLHLMETWYAEKNRIILESSITALHIAKPLEERKLLLRNGIDSLFAAFEESKVPVSVVSAGAGDVISESFKRLPKVSNLDILSNFIEFDSKGVGKDFLKPVVTSLTKANLLGNPPKRKNAFVMGDLPSDLLLAKFHNPYQVISVGFYNRDFKFEPYEQYDLLVINDGNLQAVEYLLATVAKSQNKPEQETLQPLQELTSMLSFS